MDGSKSANIWHSIIMKVARRVSPLPAIRIMKVLRIVEHFREVNSTAPLTTWMQTAMFKMSLGIYYPNKLHINCERNCGDEGESRYFVWFGELLNWKFQGTHMTIFSLLLLKLVYDSVVHPTWFRFFSQNRVCNLGVTEAEQGAWENLHSLVTSPSYHRFVWSRLQ